MDRLLIIPAAGRGSRLGSDLPKALVPVAGRPMIEHLLDRHRPFVDRVVAVIAPSAIDRFSAFAAAHPADIEVVVQQHPTGMLDAITLATPLVTTLQPRRIAITWCDQVAVAPGTAERLWRHATCRSPALVFPTLDVDRPYIHFDRDERGRIVGVRQRREGDRMPARGETDMGLFDLSFDAYTRMLPVFAGHATAAASTGERNFLPFIPWLAAQAEVETIRGEAAIETMGVNTPEELAAVEAHFRLGGGPAA
jgi:bifunctional N-acetylglucosamine-1-phosphate-uridyltransferase/glucosamine-1-phosphate-acetyltransferase GlmU-like protein